MGTAVMAICSFDREINRHVSRDSDRHGLARFLSGQMSYHAQHHACPCVPFHALARVNARPEERLAVTAPGYLALHRGLIRKLQMLNKVSNESAT
jgi:fatty acid desaturase